MYGVGLELKLPGMCATLIVPKICSSIWYEGLNLQIIESTGKRVIKFREIYCQALVVNLNSIIKVINVP